MLSRINYNLSARTLLAVLGMACCGTLGGCSASAGSDQSIPGSATIDQAGTDAFAKLGYRPVWTGFATVTTGSRLESLQVLGDVLAAQDSNGTFCLISPASGETRWATTVSTPQTRFLGTVREGRRLIVCSDNEANFYDIDTSTLLAKQRFSKLINTKPVQFGPLLVAGTASGEVLGHLYTTGIRAWLYGVGGTFETDPVLLDDGVVGLVSSTGQVVFMSASDGSTTSRHRIAGGVGSSPCGSGSVMYVASLDQSIYAFDAFGPQPLWRKRTEAILRESPAFFAGGVFVSIPGSGFTCLEAANGNIRWTTPGITGRVVAVNKGRLIVWNGTEAIVMNPDNGDVIERQIISDAAFVVPDQFVDGNLYLASRSGTVRKFMPR